MSNDVFANGREISCKSGSGKTIAAFPDVCFTPPECPATPPGVPIPYPNTGMAKDTTAGSKSVKISNKEVMLKNKSHFKCSTGDEAGSTAKKGVITSKIKGKVYYKSWSPDVKFEGKNVVRHLDTTTHNHASEIGNESIPWPFVDTMSAKDAAKCDVDKENEKKACEDKGYKSKKNPKGKDVCKAAGLAGKFSRSKGVISKRTNSASKNECMAARKCRLLPYNAKPRDGINGCCPAQTGDHIVPKSSFFKTSVKAKTKMPGWDAYKPNKAPCMCLEGGSCTGSHGLRHAHHKSLRKPSVPKGKSVSFNSEVKHCAKGAKKVAPGCSKGCIEAQLKAGHKGMGDPKKPVKYSPTGKNYDDFSDTIKETVKKKGRKGR